MRGHPGSGVWRCIPALTLAMSADCGRGLSIAPGGSPADAAFAPPTPDAATSDDLAPFQPSPTVRASPLGNTGRLCGSIGPGGIRGMAVSPDGALVAVARGDGDIQIQRASDGALLRTLDGEARLPVDVRLMSGGRLATATNTLVTLRNIDGGATTTLLFEPTAQVVALAASPDGKVIVALDTSRGGRLFAWSAVDGTPAWVFSAGGAMNTRHAGMIYSLREGVAIRRADGGVALVRWADGADVRTLFDATTVHAEDPMGMGRTVAERLAAARGPGDRARLPMPAAISPDGAQALYTVTLESLSGEVALVRVGDGSVLWSIRSSIAPGLHGLPRSAFSPDGTRIALAYELAVLVRDAATGADTARAGIREGQHLTFDARGGVWVARETAAAATAAEVVRLDLATETVRTVVEIGPGPTGRVSDLALSPDGRLVAVSSEGIHDSRVWVFGVDDGRQRFTLSDARRVVFSPDSTSLAVADYERLALFHAETGEHIRDLDHGRCVASDIAFASNDVLLAMCFQGLTRFPTAGGGADLELTDGRWRHSAFAVSLDGTRVAAATALWPASKNEWAVWGLPSGRRLAGGAEENAAFHSVAFSPDGTVLVLNLSRNQRASGELMIHDLVAGRLRQRVLGGAAGVLRFSRTGALLAASYTSIGVWRTSDWGWMRLGPGKDPPRQAAEAIATAFHGDDRLLMAEPTGVVRMFCDLGPVEAAP